MCIMNKWSCPSSCIILLPPKTRPSQTEPTHEPKHLSNLATQNWAELNTSLAPEHMSPAFHSYTNRAPDHPELKTARSAACPDPVSVELWVLINQYSTLSPAISGGMGSTSKPWTHTNTHTPMRTHTPVGGLYKKAEGARK